MPQKLLLLLLILLSSTGCKGHLPTRPKVPICMVSAPAPTEADPIPFQGCICSIPDGSQTFFLTFQQCDKYVAMMSDDFHAIGNYILAVEELAQKRCRTSATIASDALRDFETRYLSLQSLASGDAE
jgi:hypothetical protein